MFFCFILWKWNHVNSTEVIYYIILCFFSIILECIFCMFFKLMKYEVYRNMLNDMYFDHYFRNWKTKKGDENKENCVCVYLFTYTLRAPIQTKFHHHIVSPHIFQENMFFPYDIILYLLLTILVLFSFFLFFLFFPLWFMTKMFDSCSTYQHQILSKKFFYEGTN